MDMKATRPPLPAPATLPRRPWSQERRLEFIEYRLRWNGRLNRADLIQFFGISRPQASLDIAKYSELAPTNLEYDSTSKGYRPTHTFEPLFASSEPTRYLEHVLQKAEGQISDGQSYLAWAPPAATVPSPIRVVPASTLAALVQAIHQGIAINITYQSLTSPQPTHRVVSPHALAHDGFRWHVRAYCHNRKEFRDFVLARIVATGVFENPLASASEDAAWTTMVALRLAPHPKLPVGHRRAIELDYGMEGGEVEFKCRKAFLFYALRHLRLDKEAKGRSPQEQQIVLLNEPEVLRALNAGEVGASDLGSSRPSR